VRKEAVGKDEALVEGTAKNNKYCALVGWGGVGGVMVRHLFFNVCVISRKKYVKKI
jgi:hypothetical protein